MIPYGNEYTRISGIIHDVQDRQARIEFPEFGKECCIPRFFIHSPIEKKENSRQDIVVETWYLKRNRIIPLNN
jgi:hypothetical protein